MEQGNKLIDDIARRAVSEVLDDLYKIHRPIALSHSLGVSSTAFAEARGVALPLSLPMIFFGNKNGKFIE